MKLHLPRLAVALAALVLLLTGCVSVGISGDAPATLQYELHDLGSAPARRAEPLVPALLIQPLPADAMAETASIAYSRRPHEFAYYQFATWTERPVRQLPRLLQRRLEGSGIAGAVGLVGDPLRADWLLTLSVDALHHDLSGTSGVARIAMTVELFDRRSRERVARRRFAADEPTATPDAAAAAAALSTAATRAFDALLPWLDAELGRAAAPG